MLSDGRLDGEAHCFGPSVRKLCHSASSAHRSGSLVIVLRDIVARAQCHVVASAADGDDGGFQEGDALLFRSAPASRLAFGGLLMWWRRRRLASARNNASSAGV